MSDEQPTDDMATDELKRAAAHAMAAVQVTINEHPIAAVAAGASAGYILAAGIPSWLVRAGAAIAVRTVTREVVSVAMDTIAANKANASEDVTQDPVAPETARASGPAPDVEPIHVPAE